MHFAAAKSIGELVIEGIAAGQLKPEIDFDPRLMIFGFDGDQRDGRWEHDAKRLLAPAVSQDQSDRQHPFSRRFPPTPVVPTPKHGSRALLDLSSQNLTIFALAPLLAGCGESAVCNNTDVLATVKQFFEEREFGLGFRMAPGAILVQEKSAIHLASDKQTNIARCAVTVTVDLIQLIKATQPVTDEQVARMKRTGQETSKDTLVNYTVQTLASGESYITILP